jgi:hypothetical protein
MAYSTGMSDRISIIIIRTMDLVIARILLALDITDASINSQSCPC